MSQPAKLSIRETFRAMRTAIQTNFPLVWRIALACAVLNAAFNLFDLTGPLGIAVSVGFTILLISTCVGLFTAIVCLPVTPGNLGEPMKVVRPALARLVWVTLILAAASLIATAPVLVPGPAASIAILFLFPALVAAMVFWSVALPTTLVQGTGVIESLGESIRLVRGNGWRVLGFQVCIGLLGLGVLIIAAAISAPFGNGLGRAIAITFLYTLAVTPLLAIGTAELYNQLNRLDQAPASQPGPDGT